MRTLPLSRFCKYNTVSLSSVQRKPVVVYDTKTPSEQEVSGGGRHEEVVRGGVRSGGQQPQVGGSEL